GHSSKGLLHARHHGRRGGLSWVSISAFQAVAPIGASWSSWAAARTSFRTAGTTASSSSEALGFWAPARSLLASSLHAAGAECPEERWSRASRPRRLTAIKSRE